VSPEPEEAVVLAALGEVASTDAVPASAGALALVGALELDEASGAFTVGVCALTDASGVPGMPGGIGAPRVSSPFAVWLAWPSSARGASSARAASSGSKETSGKVQPAKTLTSASFARPIRANRGGVVMRFSASVDLP
jgi:hypothetical protein